MKKLFSLVIAICLLCSSSFASTVIWSSNSSNSSYANPFRNNTYHNNYVSEYNGTVAKVPATIRLNPFVNEEPQYIQGGPLTMVNNTRYEIVLNDTKTQLWNRIKFHYSLNKQGNLFDTMIIKLNGITIAQESFETAKEDDYYVWVYRPGNLTIEFNSYNLDAGNIGQSILTITNIEAYNG